MAERGVSMSRFQKIFNLDISKQNYNQKKFIKNYFYLKEKGDFVFINTQSAEILGIIEKELPFSDCPFEVVERGELKYGEIIHGWRDTTFYIFKIDARNCFTQEIQNNLPNLSVYSLEYENAQGTLSYLFYLIKNQNDLTIFAKLFGDWLLINQDPINN